MALVRRLILSLWLTIGQTPFSLGAPEPRASPYLEFGSTDTAKVSTSLGPDGTVQILPSLSGIVPHTTGIVGTNREGPQYRVTRSAPIITNSIPSPTSLLEPATLATPRPSDFKDADMASSVMYPLSVLPSADIFAEPIATAPPPANIQARDDHPVPRKGITSGSPLQTNKFYSNFFLGNQSAPTYTFPYSVSWSAGEGPTRSYGLAVSHVNASQRVFGGPKPGTGAAAWFYNPVGIQSLILSAKELDQGTELTIDSTTAFSATVRLRTYLQAEPVVSFPLVQGMGFVTALYNGGSPVIQTGVFFRTVTRVSTNPKSDVAKYRILLEDGKTWWLYAYKLRGGDLDLRAVNNGYAEAKNPFFGIIQVATDGSPNTEALLDRASGVYPEAVQLSGSASGSSGRYSFQFSARGHREGELLMWALPHHVASFDDETAARAKDVYMQTPTKGLAKAVLATKWTMVESQLPVDMGFAPYSPDFGSMEALSEAARAVIGEVAKKEISQNMIEQSNIDSMYFSGKALAKFAMILYVINDMLKDEALAQAGLAKLKQAFAIFAENKQKYPLVYERAWGGVVSSASYVTGSDSVDFGNTYYNDHHFHWGYFVLTAAIIGHLDVGWVIDNKDYVDMFVRDYANPSAQDRYFPQYRSFDWYHGHSWAHGLYASTDGKDQESSSEDVMSAFAIKMWGTVTGDADMAARGNLQLAVVSRSIQSYFLMTSDNKIQPSQFIGNKVTGILFENKCDHTTYFGTNIEYIQGIHMLPLLAPSAVARTRQFVLEEWKTYFSEGRVDRINSAWKSVIYGNYASASPREAWEFFNNRAFDPAWLDGGVSLTWYLAYAAAMGGV
ncbi:related to glucan 1,3-beta-glucosidase [Cephalotrichum gorgonifer]|uniref:glucan endo-1,3-beta-D-glucosidase n=1 Tax=Cephalotrichum gorgonifer TaxID=2041049 RepID=A0AAE8N3W3_9PEZI|nr:related to glucan 1,3-beta-glucosidase [Cephalotrichum gorgonifer]